MSFDKRFYGVYEGLVTNVADPESRYRAKLTTKGSASTVGKKVAVMYIAGDPNFPLWIGEIS